MKRADELNNLQGNLGHAFGVTKFADRTLEEVAVILGRRERSAEPKSKAKVKEPIVDTRKKIFATHRAVQASSTGIPSSVDWRTEGVVTPVKNQGQCGSCWAHSVVEEIESQWVLDGNAIQDFSVQQVNSCTPSTFGCGGGDTVAGYEYLMTLSTGNGPAAWGPYIQSMTKPCSGRRCTESCDLLDTSNLADSESLTGFYAQVKDYSYATEPCSRGACDHQNISQLAANVAASGPVSICVNAANWSLYTGGGAVMSAKACGGNAASDLDHCVQLVGYNADAKSPYWLVRNSWATDWGNDGYIYLEYDSNACGLANEATFVHLGDVVPI
jgi:C1A family cysteine protease